jgi:hypothetical protein
MRRKDGDGIALVYEDGRVVDLPGYGALDHTEAFGDEALRNDVAYVKYYGNFRGYKDWHVWGESALAVNNALSWIIEQKNAESEDTLLIVTVDYKGNLKTYVGLFGELFEEWL